MILVSNTKIEPVYGLTFFHREFSWLDDRNISNKFFVFTIPRLYVGSMGRLFQDMRSWCHEEVP